MGIAVEGPGEGEGLIFINYRRDDSAAAAAFLHAELSDRFGAASVFLDYESIPLGRGFVPILLERVRRCSVLIVVIGNRWLAGTTGRRHIDRPDDWVRIEILEALARDIPVVPVLVEGATLDSDRLPAELTALAERQYFEIRDRRQRMDIRSLGDYLSRQIPQLAEHPVPRPRRLRLRDLAARRWSIIALAAIPLFTLVVPSSGPRGDSGGPGNDGAAEPATIEVVAVAHSLSPDTDRITATVRNTHSERVLITEINIYLDYIPSGLGHDWQDGDDPSWGYSVAEDMSAGSPTGDGTRRTHGFVHLNGSKFQEPLVGRGYLEENGSWRRLLSFSPNKFLDGTGMVSIVVDVPTTHLLQKTSSTQHAGPMTEIVADLRSGSLLTHVELATPDGRSYACNYLRRREDDPPCEAVNPSKDVQLPK